MKIEFYTPNIEDANEIAEYLDLTVTERSVDDEKISMVGFPSFKLDENVEKIRSIGCDVVLAPF